MVGVVGGGEWGGGEGGGEVGEEEERERGEAGKCNVLCWWTMTANLLG